ncbi:hypothetical protein AX16_006165 [Volvariella volvacea WC 439]|nr:hypothetical protein AX16_006165 [Volvariella volvacea WC 439]
MGFEAFEHLLTNNNLENVTINHIGGDYHIYNRNTTISNVSSENSTRIISSVTTNLGGSCSSEHNDSQGNKDSRRGPRSPRVQQRTRAQDDDDDRDDSEGITDAEDWSEDEYEDYQDDHRSHVRVQATQGARTSSVRCGTYYHRHSQNPETQSPAGGRYYTGYDDGSDTTVFSGVFSNDCIVGGVDNVIVNGVHVTNDVRVSGSRNNGPRPSRYRHENRHSRRDMEEGPSQRHTRSRQERHTREHDDGMNDYQRYEYVRESLRRRRPKC